MNYELTNNEIQSGLSRVRHAERLIEQLPLSHDGRNSWLMNYGTGSQAVKLRTSRKLIFDENTQACDKLKSCDIENCHLVAVTNLDGDNLCQGHADAWVRSERQY